MSAPVATPSGALVLPGNALWVDPVTFTLLGASSMPAWSVSQAIPIQPGFVGLAANVQAWFLSPSLLPATTSNGVRIVFGN
jgi:hypothetical protein